MSCSSELQTLHESSGLTRGRVEDSNYPRHNIVVLDAKDPHNSSPLPFCACANNLLSSGSLPSQLFLFSSGKRRFRFGRRGSPCVALIPALEFDIRVRTRAVSFPLRKTPDA